MSYFSSWGPTPSLDFKPEITAPGGNIFSLANNNSYQSMSGTSMATPNTSGGEALILQAIKGKNLGITGRELVEFAKNTTINTAKILMEKQNSSIPYSPRRQGSGLLQIKDAINNNVIVTDNNGNAAISLKEIGKTTTFTINLKNYGTKDVTYTLPQGYVLSESVDKSTSLINEYSIPGANMNFDCSSITVPGKGNAKVNVTINLPDDFNKQQYVEGFIHLISKDNNEPSLDVPYLAFYGDWSALQNIDNPSWQQDSSTSGVFSKFISSLFSQVFGTNVQINAEAGTELLTLNSNSILPCGLLPSDKIDPNTIQSGKVINLRSIDPSKIAFSPNGDNSNDLVIPDLYHLRNVKNTKIDVLDANKNVLRTLNNNNNERKDLLQVNLALGFLLGIMGTPDFNNTWDGTLYDASTGKYAVASEGQYYIRITSKADMPNAKDQVIDMPVKLDVTAPQVKITSETIGADGKCSLKWTETDNGSGINPAINGILLNGQPVDNNANPITYDEKTEMYSCDVNLEHDTNNLIEIGAQDYAGNIGMDNIYVKNGSPVTVTFNNLQDNMKLNNKNFIVKGQVRDDVNSLSINGANVTIGNNLTFEQTIALQEGTNSITVKALDNNNNELFNSTYNVDCDDVAPEISLTNPSEDSNGIVYTDNNTVTISGKVTDDHFSGLKINNTDTTVDTNGNFTANVNIQDNTLISLEASDDYGNITYADLPVVYTANTLVSFDNLNSYMILPQAAANNDVYVITGHVNHPTSTFTINDTTVPLDKDMYFTFPVKLTQGKNQVKVYAEDNNKHLILDKQYKINYSKEVPKLIMSNPSVNSDGNIYTNQDTLIINGQTVSQGFNYSLYIDGSSVMKVVNAPINSSKDFSYNVPVKNGDKLDIVLNDDAGNSYEDVINVVVDKTAPKTPTITLDNTNPTNKSVLVTVNADKSDKDIAKIEYSFDHNTWMQYDAPVSVPFNTKVYAKITDFAGNNSEASLDITNIDKTPPKAPRINLDSIQPTNKDVIVTINTDQSDKEIANVQYSFDNNSWTKYTKSFSVSANTKVYAKAIDSVGNCSDISTLEIKNIDTTPPAISISGIEDGKIYNCNVKPCITSNEGTLALLLDNNVYNQEAITTEGNHIIKVRAVDEAGNISSKQVSFTIDKIAPVISVTGIENGGTYYNRASANISVNEGNYIATLDDKSYTGADITALGSHKLIITAKDTANNISAKTINFVIAPALSNDPASSDLLGKTVVALPDKTVNVNFNNTTIVNETFFRDIVGIDKNISFNVNSNNTPITWTFNGKDIDKNNLKNIDLSLNIEAPNKDVISKIDGNSQILSFKDNGVLPAPATLKIKIDSTKVNINKGIYFYYYNPATKNTELIAGPLTPDADGFVLVTIKHCSDYFFSNNDNTKTQQLVANLPKTGSVIDMKSLTVTGIGFVILGVLIGFKKRKVKKV